MKSTYLSLIALVAIFAGSQVQAMDLTQPQGNQAQVQWLKQQAGQKYQAALNAAHGNAEAIMTATDIYTAVNKKIWALSEAITAYQVELNTRRNAPDYNPLESPAMERLIQAKRAAFDAYMQAYGNLTPRENAQ